MWGRACARPVWKWTPEVYISSSGTGVSGSKMMPVLVQSPSGSVERSARARLSRLAPQIQVFFVALPLQVMGGFVVITLGLSAGMLIWLDSLQRYATWLG